MTVCIAYVRDSIGSPELILASDSRLSGGENWDFCRKIFPLDRGDAAIAFTGTTNRFFPLISQITAFCDTHKKIYSRAMRLPDLFDRLGVLCGDLMKQVTNLPTGVKYPSGDFVLLLCGWNWDVKSKAEPIFIGRIKYDEKTGKFRASRAYFPMPPNIIRHRVIAIGDCLSDFYREYNNRAVLQSRLDYEPIKILQEIVDANTIRSIGGTIQAVKIYRHCNTLPILVERHDGAKYLFGRKIFDWEEMTMETTPFCL